MAEITVCNVCGMENPAYAPVPGTCAGTGCIECLCGGDLCICHNHGDVPCDGCEDCVQASPRGDWDDEEPHPHG